MSDIPYTWGAHAPKGFTVGAEPVKISQIATDAAQALYISNLDDTDVVFLSFDAFDASAGTATVEKGLAVFPKTTVKFDSTSLPFGTSVWAVSAGSAKISVQD